MRSTRRTESAFGLAALALFAAIGAALFLFLPPLPTAPAWLGHGAPDDQPHRGGTFVFFHEADLRGLDPHVVYDELSSMAVKLLFESLIEHSPDLELVPRLARALPEISEDGLRYTFRLREGVSFHNGRELTAEDVRWSMERMLHPDTNSPGAPFFALLDGVEEYRGGRADHVRGIEVLDRYTVRFRLSQPDQTFLHAMAMTFAMPIPREHYEAGGDAARRPVGTGAFMLESWEPGVRLTFRRNPRFYRSGEPYVDRMVYELNLDRSAALMRFLSGEVDHIHRFTPSDLRFFQSLDAWRPYSHDAPLIDIWGVAMNNEMAPFDDRHVRRAVSFAINRARWDRSRGNRLEPTGQPIPALLPGYDPNLPEAQTFDLARARAEMALAGHPVRCETTGGRETCHADGLDEEIDLWIGEGPVGQAYGVLAQEDLRAIGLRIRLRPVAFPVYLAESGRPRTVPMLFAGWSMDYPDASSFFEPLFHSRSATEQNSSNRAFYRSPSFDALLDRARVERDRSARIALLRQASALVASDAPWAFAFSNTKLEAWQPYVRGYRPHPVWWNMVRDVWLDLPRRRARRALVRAGARALPAMAPLGGLH